MIKLRGYSDPPRISDLDLTVKPGEMVLLAGNPGTGKSRIVSCLAGLRRPRAQKISMAGHRPGSMASLGRSFFLFQEDNFAPGKEVFSQLVRRLSTRGVGRRRARYMLDTWSKSWGVYQFLRRPPEKLPLSVLQIFGLCELELCSFDAAVLDGPVCNLGPPVLEQATQLLLKIRESAAMLVLTDLPTTLYEVADRVVTLSPVTEAPDGG